MFINFISYDLIMFIILKIIQNIQISGSVDIY